jgi:DNA-binding transcriptional LysR family regulator
MPFDLLLSVARLGSLGLAAAEHGISQPAASTRIRRLERQLGVALIERSPRGSRLTPDGELVAGWAQAAIDAAAALDAGVASLRARSDAVLRVAASMTVAEYLLPGWLTALRARDPRTAVNLTAGNSAEVAAAVLDGGADLGFVEGPDLPAGLASHQVGADRLTVVVPPGHRWVRRRSGITAQELAATPLVAREPGSGTRRHFEEALRAQAGLDQVPPVAELSSTTAIKSAVAAGIGPAVLSSLTVAPEIAAGKLRTVKVTDVDLSRRLLAVWAAGRQLTGPAANLRAIAAHRRTLRGPGTGAASGSSVLRLRTRITWPRPSTGPGSRSSSVTSLHCGAPGRAGGQAPTGSQVVQVALLRVKLVGVASLVFQVPWNPSDVVAPGAMVPL